MKKKLSKFLCMLLLASMVSSAAVVAVKWETARAAAYDQSFGYTGSVQEYTVPVSGYYKLEAWGASGGNAVNKGEISGTGGTGGYSVGYVYLTAGQTLYICAGGRGLDHDGYVRYYDKDGNKVSEDDSWVTKKDAVDGGYNGGGSSGNSGSPGRSGSGGGATHIALNVNRGVLANYDAYRSEILLVAGGGGGGSYIHADDEEDNYYINYYGGSGGGLEGEDGEYATHGYGNGKGGTQYNCGGSRNQGVDWAEGCDGTFGQGGGGRSYAGGGGGGWYGGGCGPQEAPGGGGSGYIGGCLDALTYNGITYASATTTSSYVGDGSAAVTYLGPIYYHQTVQVRYENADGSFTAYANVIDQDYGEGSTLSWSRAADTTYQAASISETVTAAKTTQVTVYRQRYLQTVQVRYENADGTYTAFQNVINQEYIAGAALSWSRAADTTYQAASGVSYTVTAAKTSQITVYRNKFRQTVQVRYENADGTFTPYENAIDKEYAVGASFSWSRGADKTYQAASGVSYTVTAAKTSQITVYRQKYRQIVQVRYENADGTFTKYVNVIDQDCRAGIGITWARSEDATYQAAYTSYEVVEAKTSQLTVYRQKYTVELEPGTGIEAVSGAGDYRAGQSVVIDAVLKDGYAFDGWSGAGTMTDAEQIFEMPTNDLSYTANAVPIVYSISYDFAGGDDEGANPKEYTVESDAIELEQPFRIGYIFTGWTASEGDEIQTEIMIPQGSIGDRIYTAHWEARTDTLYTINQYLQEAEGDGYSLELSEEFTGTSDAEIDLKEYIREYEGFSYFVGKSDDEAAETAVIAADGGLVIDLYYNRKFYSVDLKESTGIASVSGNDAYRFGQTVTIAAALKDGYEFDGWTGDFAAKKQQYTFVMPAEDVSGMAHAKLIEYKIEYDLNGGTESGNNPSGYTVESGNITLEQPVREGYLFLGWSGSNGALYQKIVEIPGGSTGNKVFRANWQLVLPTEPIIPEPPFTPVPIPTPPVPTPPVPIPIPTDQPVQPEDDEEEDVIPTPAVTPVPVPVEEEDEAEEEELEAEEPQLSPKPSITPKPEPVTVETVEVPVETVGTSSPDRSDYTFGKVAAAAAGVGGTGGGMIFFIFFWFFRKCKIYDARNKLVGKSIIRRDKKGMFWVKISDAVCEKAGTKIYLVFGKNFVKANPQKPLKISAHGQKFYRQIQQKIELKI